MPPKLKFIVLDVLVALNDGRTIDIEMVAWPRPVFIARDLFYWARAHAMQLDSGNAPSRRSGRTAQDTFGAPRSGAAGLRVCDLRTHQASAVASS